MKPILIIAGVLMAPLLAGSFGCASAPPVKSAAVLKSEFIFESAPFPSCHASTLAETPSGLVAAWFGGTAERNPDVCIYISRTVNGQWTPPVAVADGSGRCRPEQGCGVEACGCNCIGPVASLPWRSGDPRNADVRLYPS